MASNNTSLRVITHQKLTTGSYDDKEFRYLSEVSTDLIHDNQNLTLLKASVAGILCIVKNILSQGLADINYRGTRGETPVMKAAQQGHVEVFNYLVSHGCNLSTVDNYNDTLLHAACTGGDTDIVNKLVVNHKLNTDSRGDFGLTPVMLAALYGYRTLVELLISKGCILQIKDEQKKNILHMACKGGHVDMVKYVLSLNVTDVDSRGFRGRTPVMEAVINGHRAVFDLLDSRGCDLKITDEDKSNILHLACMGGHKDMVQCIVNRKILDINSSGFMGRTPVMIAAIFGHKDIMDLLAKEGCNLKTVDIDNNNLLHLACIVSQVDVIRSILNKGIFNINRKNINGKTPMMMAVRYGHREILDLLVEEGCNLKVVDFYQNNLLHLACMGGHVAMVRSILHKGTFHIESKNVHERTPAMIAVWYGHRDILDLLPKEGCNLKAVDNQNNNLLHLACMSGDVHMVKTIISKGLFDINSRGFKGRTPAMAAVWFGHRHILDFLVKEGCDLKAVDNKNNNLLHVACARGSVNMVKHLIYRRYAQGLGKKTNIYNKTPRDIAKSHPGIAQVLKQAMD